MNFKGILQWTEKELSENRTDTIHDFLAFLAEQMIEMNRKKIEEIKGFVKWMEREIGTEIDSLANKTAIKEYHECDFNELLEVLKKNRNKISADLSSRKTQEDFERHFNESVSKLNPLKDEIEATDELIDEIVYKLYKLTEDEIKIIKGN
ncbi:MAG: hypothetical protein HY096_16075 [Nitrospinae bacterium]|nr:hypothetical protein [Nitrospinota bacterium]